jgi:two-component sensor histidine kinase
VLTSQYWYYDDFFSGGMNAYDKSSSVRGKPAEAVLARPGSDAQPTLKIRWREHGGPPVAPPVRQGFGSMLLERLFLVETGGSTSMRFARQGLEFDLAMPWNPD